MSFPLLKVTNHFSLISDVEKGAEPKSIVLHIFSGRGRGWWGNPVKTQALRSYTSDLYMSKRAPHLLPVQCIICKHEKYKVQTHSRKRVKEKLTSMLGNYFSPLKGEGMSLSFSISKTGTWWLVKHGITSPAIEIIPGTWPHTKLREKKQTYIKMDTSSSAKQSLRRGCWNNVKCFHCQSLICFSKKLWKKHCSL